MYWVEKRLEQIDELRARKEKLTSGIEPIWESLCQAVRDSIAAYFEKRTYGRFEQDKKNHHVYWVRYVEDTEKKNVVITLDAAKFTITAKYGKLAGHESRSVKLVLENADICLRNAEGDLQTADAAAYLLDPFLFPELAGKTPIPQESKYEKQGISTLDEPQ